MGKVMTKYKRILIFLGMLILMLANLAYWTGKKEGYHGDEILTYTFICQMDGDHSMNVDRDGVTYLNSWHDSAFLKQFLTLSEEERFDFAGTYRSSVQDVHPPVYYLLLEAFCSLISMEFYSKWAGIGFNMILFAITMGMVWLLAGKLFDENGKKADLKVLYTCGLYGFSIGAVSTVMLVRMYMQLTLCVVLFCLAQLKVWKCITESAEGRSEKESADVSIGTLAAVYVPLFLATVFGFLTQYYFIIFAFFMSIVIWGLMLYLRRFRDAIAYAVTMGAGILVSGILYPEVIGDLFMDYRGVEAWSNAGVMNGWVSDVLSYVKIVNNELLGGYLKLMVLLLVLVLLCCIVKALFVREISLNERGLYVKIAYQKPSFPEREYSISSKTLILWQLFFAAICYIVVVAKVAPTMNDRYIFAVYPILAIVITALLFALLSCIKGSAGMVKWAKVAVLVLVSLLCLMGYKREGVQFLYKGEEASRALVREYQDCPALLVTKQNTRGVTTKMSPYLMEHPAFYPVDESGIDGIGAAVSEKTNARGFVVYLDLEYEDPKQTLEAVLLSLGGKKADLILENNVTNIYYVGL